MYRRNSGNGIAVVLIALGAIMLLGVTLPLIHGVFRLLFPVLLVVLGYYAIKSGRKTIGWSVLAIGLLILLSKLAWLIGPLLGLALIVWGFSVMKKRNGNTY